MALTTEQESRYDQTGTVVQAYTYVHVPELVFAAPVTAFNKRAGAYVSLDIGTPLFGSLDDVSKEMTLYIGINDTRDGGSQRVRGKDIGENRILIGRAAAGQAEGQITDHPDAVVYVYDDYRPFIKAPYIVATPTPIQMKDEEEYPGDNEAQPPVAVAGIDRLIITSASSASVTLDAGQSFAVRAGATISAYAWNIKDGTITTGTDTDEEITVSFPRGARWIGLTVTDSNGITHRTHRLIVVARPEDCIPSKITGMTHDPYGNSLTLSIDAAYFPEDAPPRAKVLVAERENYGDTLFGFSERYSGWLAEETATLADAQRKYHTRDLVVEDAAAFLKRVNLFPQSLNTVPEAGGWFAMAEANIDRMLHYILHWHTNILSMCRFKWSGEGETYPFTALTTSGSSVWENVDRLARAFGHEFTVSPYSELKVVRDPHDLPSEDQALEYGLPVQRKSGIEMTFTRSRYKTYQLPAERTPQNYWLWAMGLIATSDYENATVVGAVAPSNAPNFGSGEARRTDFLVTSQDELNIRAANQFAAKDGATLGELVLTAINPSMIIDVSSRDYVAVELPDDVTERYHLDGRWTVERVEYTYDRRKTATYYLKKEVIAPYPAKKIKQLEDDDLVQAWGGFDTAIDPTTGDVTTGYSNMALTQAELEETLKKLRAKFYLGALVTDSNGNSDEDDPDGGGDPDDPTNPEYESEQARVTGGYYNVIRRIDEFMGRIATYYATISGLSEPTRTDRLAAYIQSYQTGGADVATEIATWAAYITGTDSTIPRIPATLRSGIEGVTAFMYCEGGAKTGLTLWAYTKLTELTTPKLSQIVAMIPALSEAQLEKWYDEGTTIAQDIWKTFYCYRYPPETMTLPISLYKLTPTIINYGNGDYNKITHVTSTRTRTTYNAAEGRLFRIISSGYWEDATYIWDMYYRYTKSNGALAVDPALVALTSASGGYYSVGTTPIPPQVTPPYNPAHTYDTIHQITAPPAGVNLRFRDDRGKNRTVADVTGTGLTITIYDQGNR
jgi:hypothetical protein